MVQDPAVRTSYLAWQFSQAMGLQLEKALRPLGLNLAQQHALVRIALTPGVSSADIARSAGITAQSMGTAINALIARGLITRTPHPANRRVMRLHATAEGIRHAEQAQQAIEDVHTEVFGLLSPEEQATTHALLRRLVGHLNPEALRLAPSDQHPDHN